jgi:hypothetical protein
MSGITYPITLNPTQTAKLYVEFNPTVTGAVTGQLTIASNSSTGAKLVIPITATGEASPYLVDLSWDPVTSTTLPIAGYYVFRATSGSSTFQLMTPSADALTDYVDYSVVAGVTYDYYIESVNTGGVASAPSALLSITIP